MRFYIKTYGCQMNVRDSESVSALLTHGGHVAVSGEADADVVIINTCSVREKAEDKAIGKLGLLVAQKRRSGLRFVGAMGCMVQRLGGTLFDRVHGLDFAVGTHCFSRLPQILEALEADGQPILAVEEGRGEEESLDGHLVEGVTAFVNILFGCNRRCSYCVVPDVRGPEWSRAGAGIVAEVRQVAEAGVREVTLLGQSVMAYGRRNGVWAEDYVSTSGFLEPLTRLLEAVGAVPGIERVRFTSSHPSGCTPELVRAMAELPTVCEHLHLPLQSGSDRVLRKMRRGYVTEDYRRAVARLREAMPGMALTTDFIVGFPSETVEEFEETREFVRQIGFDNSFIFKYSPRPGTEAAAWPDDVPDEEKIRRNKVLLVDQEALGLAANRAYEGRRVEVLVEGESARNASRWTGRTRTNKIVIFEPAPTVRPGDLVEVAIERARAQTLYGTLSV